MRKIKSAVKRLLGRGGPAPVTIDTVSMTENGYCLIGWYFEQMVSELKLVDSKGEPIEATVSKTERPDVKQATGKAAKGFQIIATTRLPIDEVSLAVELAKGSSIKLSLSLKGEAIEIENGQPVVSTSTGNIEGSCEYAIISDSHIFVIGWLMDEGQFNQAQVTNSAGVALTQGYEALRFNRKDVSEAFKHSPKCIRAGFSILFERSDSEKIHKRTLNVEFTVNDKPVMVPIAEKSLAHENPTRNAIRILSNWNAADPAHLEKAHIFQPIITSAFSRENAVSVSRMDFGGQVASPEVTFIIPLYGRYDFIRYQMSHFTRFSNYQRCEVLYVLDDPDIEQETLKLARQLEATDPLPFSILVLSDNVGFGGANNIGAKYARAEQLVLMNSDILPGSPDWLAKMLSSLNKPDIGIVGARLLFEDDTIQHDGMAPMTITEYPGLYFNDHPRKGWPVNLAASSDSESVCEMVTAALWAVKRNDFMDLDGFDSIYPLGDFEDSDLCLRMIEKGKINVIRRDVNLYHLERQSQNLVAPGKWKHNITLLNAVTFNDKWHDYLKKQYEATA